MVIMVIHSSTWKWCIAMDEPPQPRAEHGSSLVINKAPFGYKKLRFKSQILRLFSTIWTLIVSVALWIVENNHRIWDLNLSFL